jgi:hypothetical protein
MFAPNLPEETSPDDYITWRQSDGRFEITPKGAAASVLAIGCWDYAGYGTTPTSGEFTIRGNGSDDVETATVLQFHKTDKNSTDQSSYFNNIGSGTGVTLEDLCNSIIKGYGRGVITTVANAVVKDQFILDTQKLFRMTKRKINQSDIIKYAINIGKRLKTESEKNNNNV